MSKPLEIKQQIWLETPKGLARAKFMQFRGDDGDVQWVCFHPNHEIWTWSNWDVRVANNVTMGDEERKPPSTNFFDPDFEALAGREYKP